MGPVELVKLWLLVRPIRRARLAIARRRARKSGVPLETLLPSDIKEDIVFPQGKMTKTGVVIGVVGPILTSALLFFGWAPVECSPEEIELGCQSAEQASNLIAVSIGGLVTAVGGIISWKGRNRAEQRLQAATKVR